VRQKIKSKKPHATQNKPRNLQSDGVLQLAALLLQSSYRVIDGGGLSHGAWLSGSVRLLLLLKQLIHKLCNPVPLLSHRRLLNNLQTTIKCEEDHPAHAADTSHHSPFLPAT
jgi:hypothetical protein